MKVQSTPNSPNFGALHVGNCGGFKLFRLEKKYNPDSLFLNLLPTNVSFENLMPGLNPYEYRRWREMLVYAINMSHEPKNVTYIETYNGKPCGIITFKVKKNTELDCICTWPIEAGKKVALAGKTLFMQLFRDFMGLKEQRITLEAITDGPYNTVKKYKQLGFRPVAKLWEKIKMETDSKNVKRKMEELGELMTYEQVKPKRVNLIES